MSRQPTPPLCHSAQRLVCAPRLEGPPPPFLCQALGHSHGSLPGTSAQSLRQPRWPQRQSHAPERHLSWPGRALGFQKVAAGSRLAGRMWASPSLLEAPCPLQVGSCWLWKTSIELSLSWGPCQQPSHTPQPTLNNTAVVDTKTRTNPHCLQTKANTSSDTQSPHLQAHPLSHLTPSLVPVAPVPFDFELLRYPCSGGPGVPFLGSSPTIRVLPHHVNHSNPMSPSLLHSLQCEERSLHQPS